MSECECKGCQMRKLLGDDLAREVLEMQLEEKVARLGWASMGVIGDEAHTPFCYTIGLSGSGSYDLIAAGLRPNVLHLMIIACIDRKEEMKPGLLISMPMGFQLKLAEPIDDWSLDTRYSREFHELKHPGKPFKLLQVLWPDPSLKLPDQEGYDHLNFPQVRLKSLPEGATVN